MTGTHLHLLVAFLAALGGTVVVSGPMAYAGLLGSQIRHTEVRPGATAADAMLIEPPRAPRPDATQTSR